jgi:hypothetical protein
LAWLSHGMRLVGHRDEEWLQSASVCQVAVLVVWVRSLIRRW